MHDPDLNDLLHAMDAMVGWADDHNQDLEVGGQLERVQLRLQCLSQRLGIDADASPYLRFLNRFLSTHSPERREAASLAVSA